jgi:hypothetical protein
MSSSFTIGIIILAVVIYMIVRQFQERAIKFPAIFIIPALLTYYTCITIETEVTKHIIDPTWLFGALIVGLLPGLTLGFFRGNLAHLRLDASTGTVYAKASTLSQIIWCILLAVRIAAAVLSYTPVGQTLLPLVLLLSVMHTLFLGNIIAEKYCLYLRSNRYGRGVQQPVSMQKMKW